MSKKEIAKEKTKKETKAEKVKKTSKKDLKADDKKKPEKETKLTKAQAQVQEAIEAANKKIEEVGENTAELHSAIIGITEVFEQIRNKPIDQNLKIEELKKVRMEWKQQVDKIDKDYRDATTKGLGAGAVGVSVGATVVAAGPSVAMGIAMTFGTASTGTAISALSGAAATNAALAWLGGGALAAGGGGMAAGNALLVVMGPVGWAIAGAAALSTGAVVWKTKAEKDRLYRVFISISKRDARDYYLAISEMSERIKRIINESSLLKDAIADIKTFGLDYSSMTEKQQYSLGAYVNLMNSSTQLLINPIMGLKPRYSEDDFQKFMYWDDKKANSSTCVSNKEFFMYLANLLYGIKVDDKDMALLAKSMKKNEKLLEPMNVDDKKLISTYIEAAVEACKYKDVLKKEN